MKKDKRLIRKREKTNEKRHKAWPRLKIIF